MNNKRAIFFVALIFLFINVVCSYAASVTLRCNEAVGADGYFVQMSRDLVNWNEERDAGNNVINGEVIFVWEDVPTDGDPVYFRHGAYSGDYETGARSLNEKAGCWYRFITPSPWGGGVHDAEEN
ncbi:MAG: hypothetical protein SVO01_00470 [Thermotogota bacterium]|nr:hypothetical protein [Thermotogota bacterium]